MVNSKQNNMGAEGHYDLETELAFFNLRRWRPFGAAAIAIELILLVIYSVSNILDQDFNYTLYAIMFLSMIMVLGLVWLHSERLLRKIATSSKAVRNSEIVIILFLTFFMTWGSVLSLLDQKIYGSIAAFMLNLTVGSFMFLLRSNRIMVPQTIATLVLVLALPSFQSSSDKLIGHYANIFIVLIFSWIISYSTYATYVRDYLNRSKLEENTRLLTQINNDLITEIHSREKIQEELKRANEKLTLMSALDALTGIPNRRKMTESLNEQWESALVCHHPITLMMIDIDLFKLYNDTYGHLAGDNCLRKVAEVLSDTAGTNNSLIARFGGEEFVFVTSGLDRNEAMELGEKIRVEVEGLNLEHGYSPVGPWVTVSIGVKWLVPTFEDVLSENLTLADQAMYAAKHAGRNRVVMAD